MKFSKIFPLFTIIILTLVSIYLYPYLPDVLATHWGANGQVDGYSSKAVALFIMPVISLFLYLLFLLLPKLPQYKKNWLDFDQYYYLFVSLISAFLFYLYLLTMFWHLGLRFNMLQALSPFLAILFFYSGHLSQVSKRNWFVGIRTPWTLKNDKVWESTNTFGGKYLKIVGGLNLLSFVWPNLAVWFLLAPIIVFVPVIFIYSYLQYNSLWSK